MYQEYPQPVTTFNLYRSYPTNTYRQVTAIPEAMGYVTQSRSRAAGAELGTKGCISSYEDMTPWFNKAHSAQWRWNNQSTHLFWKTLAETLKLQTALK